MARRITTTEETETTPSEPVVRERAAERDTDNYALRKIEELVWFMLAIVLAVLLIRFILLLLGARTGVPFVDFWYTISAPFVAPFAGIFGTSDSYSVYDNGARIEPESLVAMLIYGLLTYVLVLGIRLLKRDSNSNSDERRA